jgi:DNA-binding NarL/FixJ family response regulator
MKKGLLNKRTIGFADDDYVFRNLIIDDLCKKLTRKSVFCANDGKELVAMANIFKPDMVLVDLYMPGMSGMEAIKMLKKETNNLEIIAYSYVFQRDVLHELTALGVNGYCKSEYESINKTVSNIENGVHFFDEKYYSAWSNEAPEYKNSLRQLSSSKKLSSTEINIILLSCEGKGNKEIAEHMSLSKRTIDTYVGGLLDKLDLRHKSDLISFAYRNGVCTLTCSTYSSNNCNRLSPFQRIEKT